MVSTWTSFYWGRFIAHILGNTQYEITIYMPHLQLHDGNRKRNESSTWNKCTALTMHLKLRTVDMEDKLGIKRAMKHKKVVTILLFDLIHNFLWPIKNKKPTLRWSDYEFYFISLILS